MLTHKETFTRYLREAQRASGRIAENWYDWLSNNCIRQCEQCGNYGILGGEVLYHNDDDHAYCDNCWVTAWGWTHDTTYLEVECPKDEVLERLQEQAKGFDDDSGIKSYGIKDY